MIFDILFDMDQKVCVLRSSFVLQRNAWFDSGYNLRSSTDFFVFQRNAWFDSGYICRARRRVGSGMVIARLLVTMISRCVAGLWSLHRCIRCDSSSCLLPAGLMGRLFGALCVGAGPGVMSTGT